MHADAKLLNQQLDFYAALITFFLPTFGGEVWCLLKCPGLVGLSWFSTLVDARLITNTITLQIVPTQTSQN